MVNIALVNHDGLVVGAKPRSAITPTDIYHAVFVLLITPNKQLIASTITGGKLSATAVTLCQPNESAQQAAARIATAARHHLGDQFYTSPNGRKQYISVFYGIASPGKKGHAYELIADVTARDKDCTPALQFIWQSYQHLLPVAGMPK